MHVMDYLEEVERADRNQALMARIILNTMVDAKRYPVDVSALRVLSPYNRALTTAFQEWAFSHLFFEFGDLYLQALNRTARGSDRIRDLAV